MAEVRFIGGYWAKRYGSNGDHPLIFQMRAACSKFITSTWLKDFIIYGNRCPRYADLFVGERYGAAFKAAMTKKTMSEIL